MVAAAAFQDKRHGIGMRVHNPCASGKLRCTVCENVVEGGKAVMKASRKGEAAAVKK